MPPRRNGTVDPDELLDEILAGYLAAVKRGTAPSRRELLARYPDLAPELSAFLADRDRFDRLAAPLREALAGPARLARGTVIDQYDVLEEIGRGGMGVIYKARHRTLNRIVALKMLRTGLWATPADLQRFRAEADAVANLDHPHVVPIYEVGVFQGQPYFTMKLIDGGSLAQAGVKSQDSGGRRQGARDGDVDGRRAATIVATAARAVHYAHERGILHRDIKPGNILLDAAGQPHLTDFGLAKRFHRGPETTPEAGSPSTADFQESIEAGLTQTGSILGTPSYMAPEQAAGEKGLVTTAADVYSLGAVLYELLAGRPPFRGASLLETLRQLMEQDPEPPRASDPNVDRDLETICLKCLEKDPRQRYASAQALAEDLERFLDGKPILARPVGPVERLWRWCRRQPALATVSGLAAVAVVAVVVGSIVFAFNEGRHAKVLGYQKRFAEEQKRRAEEQQRLAEEQTIRAEQQQRLAEEQKARAEQSFLQAHQAVDDFCVKVSHRLEKVPSLQRLRNELLESALSYYETFLQQRGQDPQLRRELAETQRRVADIRATTGSKSKAVEAYKKSLDIYNDLLRQQPGDIELLWRAARVRESMGINQPTAEAAMKFHLENEAVVQKALQDHPGHQKLQEVLGATYNSLGVMHRRMGHLDESLKYFERACDLQAQLAGQHPEQTYLERNLALFVNNLGIYQNDIGRPDEALKTFQRALAIRKKLADAHPTADDYQLDVAASARDIGMIYRNKRQTDEALKAFQQALAIRDRLHVAHPEVTRYKADLAHSCRDLGETLQDLGKLDEALSSFERSRKLQQELVKANPAVGQFRYDLGQSLFRMGDVYRAKKRPDDALRAYLQARGILEEVVKAHPSELDYAYMLGRILDSLGVVLRKAGRFKEAAAALEDALARQKAVYEKAPQVSLYRDAMEMIYGHLADVRRAAGEAAAAVAVSLERRKFWEGHGRPLVFVARDFTRAAEVVGKGGARLSAEEQAERRRYLDLAVETLQQAVANGYADAEYVQKQKDFDSLRGRPDFEELVRRLRK